MNRFMIYYSKVCFFFILLLLIPSESNYAQTRSRITGTVKDMQTGETLVGANILVEGTTLGAASDIDGEFIIINVPIGTYNLKASMIGYKTQIIQAVVVSLDRLSKVEIEMVPTVIQGEEVTVVAKRDDLHKEVSNTQTVVLSDDIKAASGIREINAFLEKLPGVSADNGYLTIRGGSADQTGTMVNGFSFNNAAVGNAETSVPLSAIDQVSVLSGGYNAEYGNFRSGLINITTKSGTKERYHGTINLSTDQSHMRRFGQSFYNANNDFLSDYLDPSIAFDGTPSKKLSGYVRGKFDGWNKISSDWNDDHPDMISTPLDWYLLSSWLLMTEPDYTGLTKLGYTVPEEQKKLLASHTRKEKFNDWNFDGGFGGPIPLVSNFLGDATFYISNNTKVQHYIMPVVLDQDMTSTTLLTIKANPIQSMTLTFNGLWKREIGVSPIRPAYGDLPDAANKGGFMSLNNLADFVESDRSGNTNNTTYWFDPSFFPVLNQTTVMAGLTLNHVLSPSTYYELSFNQLSISDYTPTGDNRDTSLVTMFGPFPVDESPYNKLQYAGSHYVNGFKYPWSYDAIYGLTGEFRFRGKEGDLYDNSKTDQYQLKFNISSQIDKHNFVKAGVEYNLIHLNHLFWEKWNTNAYNTYEFNYDRKPSQTGVFVQDQIDYNNIIANVGVRFDYYYGGGGVWPSDPFAEGAFKPYQVDTSLFSYLASGKSYVWDQWYAYDKEHPGFLQPVKNFFTVSPRLGISFPVTEKSKFYFNYGHFRSNPPYYSMFQFKYRYDKNGLYAMSNPNLDPPRTISYELGVAYNFYESYILRLSGYYKDITGQHGQVTYYSTSGVLNYKDWSNNEFQDIQGFEINISKNDLSWIKGWVNFNYMLKKKGLTGFKEINQSTSNVFYKDDQDRFLPTPSVNANITFRSPDKWGPQLGGVDILGNWNLTLFAKWKAGDYFTFPDGIRFLNNNLEWPDYYMVDMKLSKSLKIGGVSTTFYLDISNLFNIKVNLLDKEYAFSSDVDKEEYLKSLHLPEYADPVFDNIRTDTYYVPGNDQIGDLQSSSKPYINNPDFYNLFLYGQPRDIWFGLRVDI